MTRGAFVLALALVLLTPARGRAVSIEDLVALSRTGLADAVLIAVIDADRTVFDLTPAQVVALRKAGVSNAVIVKMLGTKREFAVPDDVAPPPVVVIGERPPSPDPRDFSTPFSSVPIVTPVFPIAPVVPVAVAPVRGARQVRRVREVPQVRQVPQISHVPEVTLFPQPPQVVPFQQPVSPGFGRFINDGWVNGVGFGRFINDGWIQPRPIVPPTIVTPTIGVPVIVTPPHPPRHRR